VYQGSRFLRNSCILVAVMSSLRQSSFFLILIAGAIFGIIHSGLASETCKNLAARWIGESGRRYYRLFFVAIAIVTTLTYAGLVVFLPDRVLYRIPMSWRILSLLLQVSALAGMVTCFSQIGTADFLGLTALRAPKENREERPKPLVTSKLYHWIRHPIYSCILIFLLSTPVMSWNMLAFLIGMAVYMVIGASLEEKEDAQAIRRSICRLS